MCSKSKEVIEESKKKCKIIHRYENFIKGKYLNQFKKIVFEVLENETEVVNDKCNE